MFFAVRFLLSKSSLPVTNSTHLRTFCFTEFIQYAFREIFVNQHVLLQLDLHWNSRKLPWRMQRMCELFVLKTVIMPFERLFVLWHPLIRSLSFIPVYSSLYCYTCDTFRPILAPLTHFAVHQFFHMHITTRNIFFLSLIMLLIDKSSEFNFYL